MKEAVYRVSLNGTLHPDYNFCPDCANTKAATALFGEYKFAFTEYVGCRSTRCVGVRCGRVWTRRTEDGKSVLCWWNEKRAAKPCPCNNHRGNFPLIYTRSFPAVPLPGTVEQEAVNPPDMEDINEFIRQAGLFGGPEPRRRVRVR